MKSPGKQLDAELEHLQNSFSRYVENYRAKGPKKSSAKKARRVAKPADDIASQVGRDALVLLKVLVAAGSYREKTSKTVHLISALWKEKNGTAGDKEGAEPAARSASGRKTSSPSGEGEGYSKGFIDRTAAARDFLSSYLTRIYLGPTRADGLRLEWSLQSVGRSWYGLRFSEKEVKGGQARTAERAEAGKAPAPKRRVVQLNTRVLLRALGLKKLGQVYCTREQSRWQFELVETGDLFITNQGESEDGLVLEFHRAESFLKTVGLSNPKPRVRLFMETSARRWQALSDDLKARGNERLWGLAGYHHETGTFVATLDRVRSSEMCHAEELYRLDRDGGGAVSRSQAQQDVPPPSWADVKDTAFARVMRVGILVYSTKAKAYLVRRIRGGGSYTFAAGDFASSVLSTEEDAYPKLTAQIQRHLAEGIGLPTSFRRGETRLNYLGILEYQRPPAGGLPEHWTLVAVHVDLTCEQLQNYFENRRYPAFTRDIGFVTLASVLTNLNVTTMKNGEACIPASEIVGSVDSKKLDPLLDLAFRLHLQALGA